MAQTDSRPKPLAVLDLVEVREKALTAAIDRLIIEELGIAPGDFTRRVHPHAAGKRLGYELISKGDGSLRYDFDAVEGIPDEIRYYCSRDGGSYPVLKMGKNLKLWEYADEFAALYQRAPRALVAECIRYVETVLPPHEA
jgi:hypothetical protein